MGDGRTSFVCIGAAHVDVKATAIGPILLHTSVPVRMESVLGGVARNIAEHLALLQQPVALVSRVGEDSHGNDILRTCEQLGIDVSGVSRSATEPSAWCAFLLAPDNEMFVGVAATAIYDALTPDLVLRAIPRSEPSVWIMDTSLPAGTILAVANAATADVRIAVASSSYAKAPRVTSALGRIDLLFVNREEAEVISGMEINRALDVERAARAILASGVKNIVITLGSAGAFALNQMAPVYLAAERLSETDTVGAGDALVAGFLVGFIESASIDYSLRCGMAASALAIRRRTGVENGFDSIRLASLARSMATARSVPDSVEMT